MDEVDYPYVVMVGQVESGKADVAKKLVHPEFVSSNCGNNPIKTSDLFWTFDGTIVICDVPEDLSESEIFVENIPLALALTFEPLSQILITVKANDDIYTVLENIRMYSETLLRLTHHDNQFVGALITDVDTISTWHPDELKLLAEKEVGLKCILFSKTDSLSTDIVKEFHKINDKKLNVLTSKLAVLELVDLSITGLRSSYDWRLKEIVNTFKLIKSQFQQSGFAVLKQLKADDPLSCYANLLFEFQAWTKDRTTFVCNHFENSRCLSSHEDEDDDKIHDMYMVTLENQIRHILFDLKMITKSYLVKRDVDPRRCPYCNEIWTKDIFEGCDGSSTCGNKQKFPDFQEFEFKPFGNYAFRWTLGSGLSIVPSKDELLSKNCKTYPIGTGCGRSITWNEMPQVELTEELLSAVAITLPSIKPTAKSETVTKQRILSPKSNKPRHSSASSERGGKYVVFIGDVGVGKSSVVEKLADKKVDRGDSKLGVTVRSAVYWSYDGTVILSDTPGSNSVQDQLQHNEEIAAAFNYRPISRVFVVVKSDIRIAEVMRVVEKYSERLLSLPDENIGVLVTHMDTVSWTPRDLQQRIIDEYGIECVLFCGKETPKEILMGEIRRSCGRTISFRVNDKNFSELFKINNKMVKILKDTSKEIDGFTELKRQFKIMREKDNALSKPAFIRDFQSWLQTQITEAEDRLAKSNNFTFSGDDAAKERGYIANLTNQIKVVFNEITSLNVVNDRANVGGNAGSEDYVFQWRNEDFTFNTVERKEEGENMSLPIPKGTPQICRPKESETSNMVKRESLPPITPYSNDQEKNISRSLEGEHANHYKSLSAMSSRLQIAPNESQNSGTTHFTFELFEESSTGDSTIRFDESKKLVKNVDLSPTFKQQIPARKTQSSELKLDHPSNDKNDESRNEFPLFSFNIVFDQRNDGHDKRMYTLQLYNKDLKVIPMETQRDDRHDKSLKSSVPLEKDWSPGHWRNISVSFDNMDALSSHTGGQDIMETAGSSTDSGTPTRTYRKKSMLNHKPDNSKTVQERTRSKESMMSNLFSGFKKNKNDTDDKRFKERPGPSALNSDQAEYNKGSFDNDGNFHVNIKNKNPDNALFDIILTPTPSPSISSSRSSIDNATALNDKCLLSNNQSKSTSLTSSRTTNLSRIAGSMDSKRKLLRARRSTKSRRSFI